MITCITAWRGKETIERKKEKKERKKQKARERKEESRMKVKERKNVILTSMMWMPCHVIRSLVPGRGGGEEQTWFPICLNNQFDSVLWTGGTGGVIRNGIQVVIPFWSSLDPCGWGLTRGRRRGKERMRRIGQEESVLFPSLLAQVDAQFWSCSTFCCSSSWINDEGKNRIGKNSSVIQFINIQKYSFFFSCIFLFNNIIDG